MSLLREIQDAATDQSTNTATLLRKCKILAVRLGNEEFKQWIDNELNGYKTIEELPEYRIIETGSYGDKVSKNAILKPRSLTGFWIQDVKAVSLLPGGSAFSRKCSLPGLGNG